LRLYDRDTTDTRDGGSIWARKLGHNYVARAFQYAHEADPKALLFYNDYGHENSPAKLDAILNLVDDFKRQGIPIHGLGLQMHLSLSTPDSAIETALRRCTATGLLIHISELDIAVSNWKKNASLQYTDSLQKRQAEKFRFVAEAYRKIVPEKQRYGITFWNVGDGDSWLRSFIQSNEWPLLFDESYERKPAYDEFKRGLVD
jgi:endo-1,4-beta-xylanase